MNVTFLATQILILLFFPFTPALATKRNWNHDVTDSITRCFEVKNIHAYCENLSDSNEKSALREELQIEAMDYHSRKFAYGYGKAIEGKLCKEHLREIRKLLKASKQVCITGYGETMLSTGEAFSRWGGLETSRGEIVW